MIDRRLLRLSIDELNESPLSDKRKREIYFARLKSIRETMAIQLKNGSDAVRSSAEDVEWLLKLMGVEAHRFQQENSKLSRRVTKLTGMVTRLLEYVKARSTKADERELAEIHTALGNVAEEVVDADVLAGFLRMGMASEKAGPS